MPKEKILKNNLTSEEYDVLEKMMKSDLQSHKINIDKRVIEYMEILLAEQNRIKIEFQDMDGRPVVVRPGLLAKKEIRLPKVDFAKKIS